jgi:hypothetical protein
VWLLAVSKADESVKKYQTPALGANTRCDCPEWPVASPKVPEMPSPMVIGAGAGRGVVAPDTVIRTVIVAVAIAGSVGVKVTVNGCAEPTGSTVPDGGVYTKLPGTFAVAFSCDGPSAVPYTMSAGLGHVTTGRCWSLTGTISIAAKFQMWSMGAVSLSVTAVPAAATVPSNRCTHNVSLSG